MSVHISSWVWKESPAKGPDLVMHLALADIARHDCVARTTAEELMQHTRLTDRKSISRGLSRLVAMGLISEVPGYQPGRGHKLKSYRLHVPAWVLEKTGAAAPLSHHQQTEKGGSHAPDSGKRGVDAPHKKVGRPAPESGASGPLKWGAAAPALKEAVIRNGTVLPPNPPSGGIAIEAKRAAEDGRQTLRDRLWAKYQRQASRTVEREWRRRLISGEQVESVWESVEAELAEIDRRAAQNVWEPPEAHPEAEAVWQQIRDRLRDKRTVSDFTLHTWFMPVWGVGLSGNVLTVATPSRQSADYISGSYGSMLNDIGQTVGVKVRVWMPGSEVANAA